MEKEVNEIKEKEYKYKFSVIIPIYNVEDYLEETILSIINQDIGFEENIQMILVNDGSPDNCEEICLKYKELYPDNIIYLKQENSGVSVAKNNGIKYIEGKYTNFLDSDDKWNLNVFSRVWKFFEENKNKIDIVGCRMKFFEVRNDYHILDYKFTRDKIVDLKKFYHMIQLSIASSFLKSSVLEKYQFDENLKYAEDALLAANIIMDKCQVGIMKSAVYNYRKRKVGTSALDNTKSNKEWFTGINIYYKKLIDEALKRYGMVIPYIQYQLMYDIQWRLKVNPEIVLDEEETKEYRETMKYALQYVDDYIIVDQKNIYSEYKMLALSLKHGYDIRKDIQVKLDKVYYNNLYLNNLKNINLCKVDIMKIKDGKLIIEGQVNCVLRDEDYVIYIQEKNGEKYQLELTNIHTKDRDGINGVFLQNKSFKVELPLKDIKQFKIMLKFRDFNIIRLNINFGRYAKINKNFSQSYFTNGKYIITQVDNIVYIRKNKNHLLLKKEYRYWQLLRKLKEKEILKYRICYFIHKKFSKKKVWIVSDRTDMARDNGIQLFKYLQEHEKNAKVYFAIEKKCDDYKMVKKIGKVLKFNSFRYKLNFLLASKIISSQADECILNAFGLKEKYVKDLYKFDYVFLQHGITKDDLSSWLNKYSKNIALFVTCTNQEYSSIINDSYVYTDKEVKLTGFPRYDILENKPQKKIIFMPTWRKNISTNNIAGSSTRMYNEKFKESEYFKFYNSLINDERLLECLKKNGYKAKFCIHPAFLSQSSDFEENALVEVSSQPANYNQEFEENALLITDFSSVAFDFAYLNKPVIYTQFDADDFFEEHSYNKGYYDYERDGFGPICYDYETSLNEIIKCIENDCKLEKKYEQRINDSFAFHDRNNCKRVYEEILKL